MKNIILSVLFWAVASVCMAIKLPSTSYSAYSTSDMDSESYTMSIGTTIANQAVLSAYNGGCINQGLNNGSGTEIGNICTNCCADELCPGLSAEACQTKLIIEGNISLWGECMKACEGEHLPLGSPLLLLPFALVYAIVRRKRKEETL